MLETLFNKVEDLRSATLLKERLQHRCLLLNFDGFLRTPFFIEHLNVGEMESLESFLLLAYYSRPMKLRDS